MDQQQAQQHPAVLVAASAGEWELIGEPLAEAAVLGCLLGTTARHAREVLADLAEPDWTVPQHAHVAAAISVLLDQGIPVDPVTVLGQLRRQGTASATTADRDAGVLLLELYAAAPCASSASHYAHIVREHSYRRRVRQAAVRLLTAASGTALQDLHELVEREHTAVTAQHDRTRPAPAGAGTTRHCPT